MLSVAAFTLRSPRSGECSTYLRELNALFPQYARLALADPDGLLTCRSSTKPGTAYVGDRQYFQGAVRTGRFTAGEYLVSRMTGKPAIALSIPTYEPDGRLHGVLYAAIELTYFHEHLSGHAVPHGLTDVVTDGSGIVLASAGEQTHPIGQGVPYDFLAGVIRHRQPAAGRALDRAGREWLYAANPANAQGTGGLDAASLVSTDAVLSASFERLRKELLLLLGITSAALLLAWQIGDRALAKPVRVITSKVNALEQGTAAASLPAEHSRRHRARRRVSRYPRRRRCPRATVPLIGRASSRSPRRCRKRSGEQLAIAKPGASR